MLDNTLVCDSCRIVTASSRRRSASSIGCRTSCRAHIRALQQRVAALDDRARGRAARDASTRPHEAQRTAERLRSLLATLPAGVVVVDDGGRIQEHNRAAEEILGAGLAASRGKASCRTVLKNPSSADGDWLTRDGRRIALAASALPQETIEDHSADRRDRDARAARARRAQSTPERHRQDGRELGSPDPHAARRRAAVSVAVPLASRRARAREAAREGHRAPAPSRPARAGHARVRARQRTRASACASPICSAPCTMRRWP